MTDPRAENCRRFLKDAAGKVVGVDLKFDPHPDPQYRLVKVELRDEYRAMGNTVATCRVEDADGFVSAQQVTLAWPYPDLTEFAMPGNPNGEHTIPNSYNPPKRGPLALAIWDRQGGIISDVIGGLGLPESHHVSFVVTFREVGALPDPDPDPGEESDVLSVLKVISQDLKSLLQHLGGSF